MSRYDAIYREDVVEVVTELYVNDESGHLGEGPTAARVAEEFGVIKNTVQRHLREAVEDGDLETRPAVTLDPGIPKAYIPAK